MKRAFITAVLTCLALLATAAAGLRWYALRHFLPEQRMSHAVAAGDGCILLLGDSRMDAATDMETLHRTLREAGRDGCVAQLAIGGTEIPGIALTAREYLARGPRPRVAVIGKVGDSLLGDSKPIRPEAMVGNNAIHLTWSRAGDVFDEVPGFPWASVDALDTGLRFLSLRATPLGQYGSLIAVKTQQLAERLTGSTDAPKNRFGALGDMAVLEKGLQARAPRRLAAAMQGGTKERMGGWFGQLAALLHDRAIPFFVVELPAPGSYRELISETAVARDYQAWLSHELERWDGSFVDLSGTAEIYDTLFADELHLAPSGATVFSTALGQQLGARLAH